MHPLSTTAPGADTDPSHSLAGLHTPIEVISPMVLAGVYPSTVGSIDTPYSTSPYPHLNNPLLTSMDAPLAARMCTVSHCHKVLPGYYRYKRCEQHRLQNRYHSQLKRYKERSEKAGGSDEDVEQDLDVVMEAGSGFNGDGGDEQRREEDWLEKEREKKKAQLKKFLKERRVKRPKRERKGKEKVELEEGQSNTVVGGKNEATGTKEKAKGKVRYKSLTNTPY